MTPLLNLVAFVSFWLLAAAPVGSEVVLDGSLGSAGPVPGPGFQIEADFGQQAGANLFHSFEVLNIAAGESATFNGPAEVTQIIGRVTGGRSSTIDGLLRSTIDGADLFLVNPAGILFGANARLDVQGSFYASTADYLLLADGGRFDASVPQNSQLTIAPVSAFGFLDDDVAPIRAINAQLAVSTGNTLALVGGDLEIAGVMLPDGENTDVLSAPSGLIHLAALAAAGEVPGPGGAAADVVYDGLDQLGRIEIRSADVTTRSDPGGTIYIRGGDLLIESSTLSSTSEGTADHPGTGIDIVVRNQVDLIATENNSEINSSSFGAGEAGDSSIGAGTLNIVGTAAFPALVRSGVTDSGIGGRIDLNVGSLSLATNGRILSSVEATGSGSGGTVSIRSDRMSIDGSEAGSFISSSTLGSGNAGNIEIDAQDIELHGGNGFTGLASQVSAGADGSARGGRLVVAAGGLEITGGAQINASIFSGDGRAGDIEIEADNLLIAGSNAAGFSSGVFTGVEGQTTTGDGGDIRIDSGGIVVADGGQINASSVIFGDAGNVSVVAEQLEVSDGSFITVSNFGAGVSGDLSVTAGRIELRGPAQPGGFTGLFSLAGLFAATGGRIDVFADTLSIADGARVDSSTSGGAAAGDVNISATELTLGGSDINTGQLAAIASGSAVFGQFANFATGNGGNVNVESARLTVRDGAEISVSTNTSGDAGSIALDLVRGRVELGGAISARSNSTGNAGNVDLIIGEQLDLVGGSIVTVADTADGGDIGISTAGILALEAGSISAAVGSGEGQGGNIRIDSRFVVMRPGQISADAFGGPGGNIRIGALSLFASGPSTVSASSSLSVDGEIVIDAPQSDIAAALEVDAVDYLDSVNFHAFPCGDRLGRRAIRLTSVVYEVLPESPRALRAPLPLRGPRSASVDRVSEPWMGPSTWAPVAWSGGCDRHG